MEVKDEHIIQLISQSKTRNQGFKLLIQAYKEPLYWQIRRTVGIHEDADDILQNVFIKVFRKIDSFNKKSSLYTWMFRISANETIDFLRKNKRFITEDIEQNELIKQKSEPIFSVEWNGDTISKELTQIISMLPTKQKMVFEFRYFQNLSYADIAKILETSVSSAKTNYHFAVQKIKQHIQNLDYYV